MHVKDECNNRKHKVMYVSVREILREICIRNGEQVDRDKTWTSEKYISGSAIT